MNHEPSTTELSSSNFAAWATEAYRTKKEAVDFLENSLDPIEHAKGVLIKRYAGVSTPE